MKKLELLALLEAQAQATKKSTRKDIVKIVSVIVDNAIKNDNAEIEGINPTRNGTGFNLGEIVEVAVKSLFRNKLAKSEKNFDATIKGQKVEIKFATSDAYAHPINPNTLVDYYLIITYTKANGLIAFKVPTDKKDEIQINAQCRVITNQKAKFIDYELTEKLSRGL